MVHPEREDHGGATLKRSRYGGCKRAKDLAMGRKMQKNATEKDRLCARADDS